MKSAVEHALGMDIHNDEIGFNFLQGSDDDAMGQPLFHSRRNLAPVSHSLWNEIFQLIPDPLNQGIFVFNGQSRSRIVDDVKQGNLRVILSSDGICVIQRIGRRTGEIDGDQDSAECWSTVRLMRRNREKRRRTNSNERLRYRS